MQQRNCNYGFALKCFVEDAISNASFTRAKIKTTIQVNFMFCDLIAGEAVFFII
jgi:hypothetical protein